jgi:hypothetical protein
MEIGQRTEPQSHGTYSAIEIRGQNHGKGRASEVRAVEKTKDRMTDKDLFWELTAER